MGLHNNKLLHTEYSIMNNDDIKINDNILLSGKNGNGFKLVLSNTAPHLGGNCIGEYEYNGKTYKGDCNSITIDLWKYLIEKFKIKTVLDVGCGCGYTSEIFKKLGCAVTCFDGLSYNIENSDPSLNCFVHDLTTGPFCSSIKYDLVWCCEVAEHIEEKYINNLIQTLKNGKVIAMTAAQEGDGGHHHVNLKNKNYWIQKIEDDTYQYNNLTNYCREIASSPDARWESHFKRNGLLFTERSLK